MFKPTYRRHLKLLHSGPQLRDAFLKYVVQTQDQRTPLGDFVRRVRELSMADTEGETAEVVLHDLSITLREDGAIGDISHRAVSNIMSGGWRCFEPGGILAVRGGVGLRIESCGYTLLRTEATCWSAECEPVSDVIYDTMPPAEHLARWRADDNDDAKTDTCVRCAEEVPVDDIDAGLCSWCAQLTR